MILCESCVYGQECILKDTGNDRCPNYEPYKKPTVYNWKKAEERVAELISTNEELRQNVDELLREQKFANKRIVELEEKLELTERQRVNAICALCGKCEEKLCRSCVWENAI